MAVVVEPPLPTLVEVKTAGRRRQSHRDRVRQVAERLQRIRFPTWAVGVNSGEFLLGQWR